MPILSPAKFATLLALAMFAMIPLQAQETPAAPPELTDELTDVLDVLQKELEIQGKALQKELNEHQGEIEEGLQSTIDELYQSLKSELDAASRLIDEYNADNNVKKTEPGAAMEKTAPGTPKVQQELPCTESTVTQSLSLKYLDPQDFADLAEGMFPVEEIRADGIHKILLMRGTAEAVKAVEDAAAKMDVAPPSIPNIALQVYFVEVSSTPWPDAKPLPDPLQAALMEYSAAIPTPSFNLAGDMLMRVRSETAAEGEGMIALHEVANMINTKVSVREVALGADHASIRLDEFLVGVEGIPALTATPVPGNTERVPQVTRGTSLGFRADVDLAPGQAAVVGKTGINKQGSFLLVLVQASPV